MSSQFITTAPTLVHDFSDLTSEWTLVNFSGASGTKLVGGAAKTGTSSIRLTNDATNSNLARIHRDGTYDFSGTGSADDLIHLVLHFESGELGQTLGEGTNVTLYVTDGLWSNYAYTNRLIADRKADRPEWVVLSIKKSDFRYVGSWSDSSWNTPAGRLAVAVGNNFLGLVDHADYYGDATFDGVFVGGSGPVPITFSFDDNFLAQNDMIDDLDSYGWKTSLVSSKNYVDRPGNSAPTKISLSDMLAHQANGHRIINHGTAHVAIDDPIDPPTAGQISDTIDDIQEGYEFHSANFITLPYYAATRGAYNQETIDYVVNNHGVIAHRDARDPANIDIDPPVTGSAGLYWGYSSLFTLDQADVRWGSGCFELSVADAYTDTGAKVIAEIDKCIARNIAVHLYTHEVVTGATVTQFERADWEAILAHIQTLEAAGTVLPMAWHEWANEMTGYIEGAVGTVSHSSNTQKITGVATAAKNDTVLDAVNISRYRNFTLFSTTGSMTVKVSLAESNYSNDMALSDRCATDQTTLVMATTAGKPCRFSGNFQDVWVFQEGATGVSDAILICSK